MMDTSLIQKLFQSKLKVVNVGPSLFATALERQGYETVQVDWIPPAGGDAELQELLKIMGGLDE